MYYKRNQNFIRGLCLLFLIIGDTYAMTKPQLKKMGRVMQKSCMPKTGVTHDEVGEIEDGKFIEEKKVMCYIACIYTTSQVVKNNKLMIDLMIKQIETMFPNDVKEVLIAAANKCRYLTNKHKDICEVSYYVSKCMYDLEPDAFIFP